MKIKKTIVGVACASAIAVTGMIATPPESSAYSQTSAVVERTDGEGVGCRTGPSGPVDCGYGAPEGATLGLQCFYPYGDPVGPNGNTVWWRVTYGAKTFFVADHWLDTPAPVGKSPTWYHGASCQ